MRKVIGAILCLLLVGIVAVLWVRAIRHEEELSAPESVSLRLAWLPGATFVGDYVALKQGFWKKRGLDVKVEPGGFEFDAIKLVAAGSDTFGVTSGPQLLQARASGVPVVAVGATIPRSPIGWVSKSDSGIAGPQDFDGKRIGAQFGTHTEITLEAMCRKLGIPLQSFQRVPVKFDPRPFVMGEVDVLPVYIIDQPVDLSREGLQLNIIDPGEYGVSLSFGNLYFTREEIVRDSPDLVRAFLAGAREGWVWSFNRPGEAVEILSEFAPDTGRDTLSAKLRATFDFIMKDNREYEGVFPMRASDWGATLRLLREAGSIEKDIKVESSFTNEFLD